MTSFIMASTSMTLNRQNKVFLAFCYNFRLRRTFQEWIIPKWLKIYLDNLRMKFLAWNVHF